MINLTGTLINAFRLDGGKGKDGKEYEARQGANSWFAGVTQWGN